MTNYTKINYTYSLFISYKKLMNKISSAYNTILEVIKMGLLNDKEIPIGLGMALAKNIDAMKVFSDLDEVSRNHVIQRSHHARSKEEMDSIVNDLIK